MLPSSIYCKRTPNLLDKLLLESIDTYICCQQLRLTGNVCFMPWGCLPCKMLTFWVHSNVLVVLPRYTYGQLLMRCLKKSGMDCNHWHYLALNSLEWRKLIYSLKIYLFIKYFYIFFLPHGPFNIYSFFNGIHNVFNRFNLYIFNMCFYTSEIESHSLDLSFLV